jgi:signal peptidase II
MLKINFKKFFLYSAIVIFIFILDRISKLYILNSVEINNEVNIYIFSFLKLYLIWNKGIAFGLFSFEQNFFYNFITILITAINLVILIMIIKSNDIKSYFLMFILGGSLGNLFDRLYYSAVPDFIDFHINDFHWFIFNVADVFISVGVICLIIVEFFFNKTSKK